MVTLVIIVMRARKDPKFLLRTNDEQNRHLSSLEAAARDDSIALDSVIPIIQSLLLSLMKDTHGSDKKDAFDCPVTRAIIMMSVGRKLSFQSAEVISTMLAGLIWMFRAAAAKHIFDHANGIEGAEDNVYASIQKYLLEGFRTPVDTIRAAQKSCKTMVDNQPRKARFAFGPPPDYSYITIDSRVIVLEEFYQTVRNIWFIDTKPLLRERLLRGHTFPDFENSLKRHLDPKDVKYFIYDNPRAEEFGYSFLDDPRNTFIRDARHLLVNKLLFSEEFCTKVEGKLVWLRPAIEKYLLDHEAFIMVCRRNPSKTRI